MSRTLGDDFDEEDASLDLGGGGSLDLERGSQTGAGGMGGASTAYDGSGMEFDDDPYGEGIPGGALELDLPPGSATALRAASTAPAPAHPAGGRSVAPPGGALPDLAFGAAPTSQPPLSSQSSIRPQGALPSIVPSSQRQLAAERPLEGGSTSQPPNRSTGHPAPTASNAPLPLPPARPTAASVIANYPPPPPQVWLAPKYAIQVLRRQFDLRSELQSLRRRRSPDVPLYEAALQEYDAKTFRLGVALNIAMFAIATFIFFLPVTLRFLRAD